MALLDLTKNKLNLSGKSGSNGDAAPLNGAELPVHVATLRVGENSTVNVPWNENCGVVDENGKRYTLPQWNAMFVQNHFDTTNMPTPVGFYLIAGGERTIYYFDRFDGAVYNIVGLAAHTTDCLQHSPNDFTIPTSATSGTDASVDVGELSTAGKANSNAWSVTKSGGKLIYMSANTGRSFEFDDDVQPTHYLFIAGNHDALRECQAISLLTEWLRDRFAVSSGIATTEEDGTIEDVEILNLSGEQAAANEDMYFWVGGQNSGLKAKYNLNNKHNGAAYLTSAIADAIYESQKSVGINMNDTGVNSETKPILAPGSKGAEAIAVNGYWMIITPYVSNCNATISTATNNIADAPAVNWALQHGEGHSLPTDFFLNAMRINLSTLITPLSNYLVNSEGWTLKEFGTGEYSWCASRYNTSSSVCVYLYAGGATNSYDYNRYFVVAVSAF